MEDNLNDQNEEQVAKSILSDDESGTKVDEMEINSTIVDIDSCEESNGIGYEIFTTKINP